MIFTLGYSIVFASAIVALIWQLFSILLVWENRRFVQSHLNRRLPQTDATNRQHALPFAEVIVPCKGVTDGLEANLRRFFQQEGANYQITFVVESQHDPAISVIRQLQATYPDRSRLVIAGRSEACGQKVHNLRFATGRLYRRTEVIVFADSDVRPDVCWLKSLLVAIQWEGHSNVTGYRWLVPARNTLANWLVCSVNAGVIGVLGRHPFNLIWGGTWAVRRRVFSALDIRAAWFNALSDDLVASRCFKNNRQRIIYEPAGLGATQIDLNWRSAIEFMRRQFLIVRKYVPAYWWCAFALTLLTQFAFWANAVFAIFAWSNWPALAACSLGASAALYLAQGYKAKMRQEIVAARFREFSQQYKGSRQFDLWAFPLYGLFNLLGFLISSVGSTIRWSGVVYHIGQAGQIKLLGRVADLSRPGSSQTGHLKPNQAAASPSRVTSQTGSPLGAKSSADPGKTGAASDITPKTNQEERAA